MMDAAVTVNDDWSHWVHSRYSVTKMVAASSIFNGDVANPTKKEKRTCRACGCTGCATRISGVTARAIPFSDYTPCAQYLLCAELSGSAPVSRSARPNKSGSCSMESSESVSLHARLRAQLLLASQCLKGCNTRLLKRSSSGEKLINSMLDLSKDGHRSWWELDCILPSNYMEPLPDGQVVRIQISNRRLVILVSAPLSPRRKEKSF